MLLSKISKELTINKKVVLRPSQTGVRCVLKIYRVVVLIKQCVQVAQVVQSTIIYLDAPQADNQEKDSDSGAKPDQNGLSLVSEQGRHVIGD